MKKFLFGCAIAVGGFAMPLAAAQNCCCPPQCNSCCCPEFNGLYIGGNVGVFSHTAHRNDFDGFLTNPAGWSFVDTDVTAGAQVGYDFQCGYKLIGVVADWNWVNIDRKHRESPNNLSVDRHIKNNFDWFTTIRARFGLAVCDALVYVTGGAAVSRYEVEWRDDPTEFKFHETRWGWTGGAGAELLLGCSFSLGAEVLYLHFDKHEETFTVGGTTPASFTFGHSESAWVGRILLNYRFGDLCCWFR